MADTMTSGVVDAPINSGGAAVTEKPESSQGSESAASGTGTEQADGSQGPVEGGSVDSQGVRQRGPSKLDTIRELRAKLRDQRGHYDSEIGTLKTQLEEIRSQIASGPVARKPSKTFWEAPEEVFGEQFDTKLSAMEKRLLDRFEQRESTNQETAEWKSETSEATKFIQTHKDMTPEDQDDIADIVRSTPAMQNLRPMDRAKYALFLWKEERGITDHSAKKARASTVTGAPPVAVGGKKTWTKAEVEAELAKFPDNPANYTPEDEARFKKLDDEWRRAVRDNRMIN